MNSDFELRLCTISNPRPGLTPGTALRAVGSGIRQNLTLRSRKHEINAECITKTALSASDDKRYIVPNDLEHRTLALGHYSLDIQ